MTNGNCAVMYNIKDSKRSSPGTEDMGFCSGEDYVETNINSPTTGTSEDSNTEIRVSPISINSNNNNKRKISSDTFTGPLKKRMCLKVKAEIQDNHPFRPWSPAPAAVPSSSVKHSADETKNVKTEPIPTTAANPPASNFGSYFRPPSPISFYHHHQTEPVALVVKKRDNSNENNNIKSESDSCCSNSQDDATAMRVPIHPQIHKLSTTETERMLLKSTEMFPSLIQSSNHSSAASTSSGGGGGGGGNHHNTKKTSQESQRREQRNYKNMTRERRIEANARERTRVHTISAAFDTLRRSVPAYSHNQKLSKLSVLRIACSYIMTLSSIVSDDPPPADEPDLSECVDMVSKTIQREGKLRKKKDDND